MEFFLLAAIFLTSSGFLIGAAVAPDPPGAIEQSAVRLSVEQSTTTRQPRPQVLSRPGSASGQQNAERPGQPHKRLDACEWCDG